MWLFEKDGPLEVGVSKDLVRDQAIAIEEWGIFTLDLECNFLDMIQGSHSCDDLSDFEFFFRFRRRND